VSVHGIPGEISDVESKTNYCLTLSDFYYSELPPTPLFSPPPPHCLDPFCLPRINVLGNNLFPLVEYPVPVGTPLISPYIKWDHSQDWDVPKAEDFPAGSKGSASASLYNIGVFACLFFLFVCLFSALPLHFFCKTRKRIFKAVSLKLNIWFGLKKTRSASEMG